MRNHCCRGKAISITHSVCVCARARGLSYQAYSAHVPYCHVWPVAVPYFSIYHRGTIFGNQIEKQNGCFDFLYSFV